MYNTSLLNVVVSEMTYTVSSGTLNSTIPYHTIPYHTTIPKNTSVSTYIWRILATMHIGSNVSIENMLRINDTNKDKSRYQSKHLKSYFLHYSCYVYSVS